jgi:hypothetical protein
LQDLDLSGTQVSQSGLESLLADLPRLETLDLSRTGIGWWALAKLRLARRDLKIVG